jgi:hypothetical protein
MKSLIGQFLFFIAFSMLSLNTYAEWQCRVADSKGHLWESVGQTQERANGVATSFCSSFSPNGGCHTSQPLLGVVNPVHVLKNSKRKIVENNDI